MRCNCFSEVSVKMFTATVQFVQKRNVTKVSEQSVSIILSEQQSVVVWHSSTFRTATFRRPYVDQLAAQAY